MAIGGDHLAVDMLDGQPPIRADSKGIRSLDLIVWPWRIKLNRLLPVETLRRQWQWRRLKSQRWGRHRFTPMAGRTRSGGVGDDQPR